MTVFSARKQDPILGLANSYLIDSPEPSNISYWWNLGSLLGLCLVLQIVTGIFLVMHYTSHITMAFSAVDHIMRDVNYGWALRYAHANGASFFFFFVYLHMGKNIYYGSYKYPRIGLWTVGVIIFLIMIITAFMGYCCVYGQMSHWGVTVITNLVTALPIVGQPLVNLIWGGPAVGNPTIQRFFSLHYLLPFILAALVCIHLIYLHTNGSGNPLGILNLVDRIPFSPYFIFKDLVTILIFMLVFSIVIFYYPNAFGDSENYIEGNPMVTPPAIVPEWYLLPFYAILRSIPNKLLGVIAMLAAILILLALPLVDRSIIRGLAFKPLTKFVFWLFICNFILLGQIGTQHIEAPYILLGQIATIFYFSYFIVIVPLLSYIDNTLYYITANQFFINKK
uniref:Cytochrome b n=1 Tax=Groenewaldozyma salmanticensis TaxID=49332 RepID=E5L087_9ASCO|nr:apocytochrome b [Groenewaldozyma salmanticensis]ADO51053.1 apocytochrome b [Groenewaldozyma salmanticensis]